MKKWILLGFILCIFSNLTNAQDTTSLATYFDDFVGCTWVLDTTWSNDVRFHQEVNYEYTLNKTVVKAQTYGTINFTTKEFGLRNEGIRMYDKGTETFKFWEFDIFGGITEGKINFSGDSTIYTYEYNDLLMQDVWIKEDVNTYTYLIRSIKDGEIQKIFLQTQAIRKED